MELAPPVTFYKDMTFSFVNNSSLDCSLLSFSFLIDSYSYHNTIIPKKQLFHLTNSLLSFSFLIDSYSYHNTIIPKKQLFHLTNFNFPFSNNYPLSSLFPFFITWGHCNQPSQPSFTHHILSLLFSVFRK